MSKAKGFDSRRFKRVIIILIAFLAVVLTCTIFFILQTPQMRFLSHPEQQAQVEVTEKRIDRRTSHTSINHGGSRTIFFYQIFFQFPDGTVKEFEVDKFALSGIREEAPYSTVYAGINEGDTGILTYKELGRGTVDLFDELSLRKFISFEQDVECGSKNFYWIDRTPTSRKFVYGFLLLSLSAVMFFMVYAFRYHKQILKSKEQRKLLIRERAEQQAAWQRQQSQEERQRRQAQEEQQQKRKRQKQRQKRQRKKQKK